MAIKRRSLVAIGVLVLLGGVVALSTWYDKLREQPRTTEKSVTVHVTNGGDRGPGTLREALFIVAGATAPTTIALDIPAIKLETALPALVNGRGIRLVGQPSKTQIDAQSLESGPVLDVSGPNTSVEGVTVTRCPAAAILEQSVHEEPHRHPLRCLRPQHRRQQSIQSKQGRRFVGCSRHARFPRCRHRHP